MRTPRRPRVSEAEFLALPESMEKTELIDGEVIVSPAPTSEHQDVLFKLAFAAESWARSTSSEIKVLAAPVDIRFAENRILQPDLSIWLAGFQHPESGPVLRVPTVCAEVLSTNRVHDRVTKRLIYAASGVRELWIVERRGPIERWSGEALDVVDELADRLTSTVLPGLDVDLSSVFASVG
ncbi:MAG: Uma2 family endonuclease [Deltaproteobacteria bacterium]